MKRPTGAELRSSPTGERKNFGVRRLAVKKIDYLYQAALDG